MAVLLIVMLSVPNKPWAAECRGANEGESAASFCHQLAGLFPDMLCKFYLVKNHEIAKKSVTTKAREKISTDLESLEF